MKKIVQKTDELLGDLSTLESAWKDDFAREVISFLDEVDSNAMANDDNLVVSLLERDFEVASTVFRLFLEKSKDEYTSILKELIPEKGMAGKTGFSKDKTGYSQSLRHLLLRERIVRTISHEYTWKDIIIERLKAGRGSAIKGQVRGRQLENFVESIVGQVFTKYDPRCSFIGRNGQSSEKADFAIPTKNNPEIVIEVKGYGATGSKQTDVIGDIKRIISEKRHDTVLLLFTDGVTWRERKSDFTKLVDLQNQGFIYRIYTKNMADDLLADLQAIKLEKNIK